MSQFEIGIDGNRAYIVQTGNGNLIECNPAHTGALATLALELAAQSAKGAGLDQRSTDEFLFALLLKAIEKDGGDFGGTVLRFIQKSTEEMANAHG